VVIGTGLAVAVLRYRLYDIDLIIRKTVQYGVLTAVLALVYFGTIILLQSLVGQAMGEQSPIIIVLSTLLIAAMFNPLRRRVQTAVDRRFYRQKYDAQQVLAQFAQTARDETDMEALTDELVRVVQETMQPESMAVWFKTVERKVSHE
jgi:predicted component of type VI protein secretion system